MAAHFWSKNSTTPCGIFPPRVDFNSDLHFPHAYNTHMQENGHARTCCECVGKIKKLRILQPSNFSSRKRQTRSESPDETLSCLALEFSFSARKVAPNVGAAFWTNHLRKPRIPCPHLRFFLSVPPPPTPGLPEESFAWLWGCKMRRIRRRCNPLDTWKAKFNVHRRKAPRFAIFSHANSGKQFASDDRPVVPTFPANWSRTWVRYIKFRLYGDNSRYSWMNTLNICSANRLTENLLPGNLKNLEEPIGLLVNE